MLWVGLVCVDLLLIVWVVGYDDLLWLDLVDWLVVVWVSLLFVDLFVLYLYDDWLFYLDCYWCEEE